MTQRAFGRPAITVLLALIVLACSVANPTAGSSSTATPAVATAPSKLPYRETWSNPGTGWEIGTFDTGILRYGQSYYAVTSSKKDQLMWGLAYKRFSDIAIDVDATQFSASDDNNNAYGVMCRAQPNDDGYLLRISGDGQAAITRIQNDKFEELVAWAASDAVRQGNATNHLLAACEGSKLSLTVNGQLVAQVEDTAFTAGDIALTATTYTDTPTEIHYESLVVTAP